jgi:hypothetical protein
VIVEVCASGGLSASQFRGFAGDTLAGPASFPDAGPHSSPQAEPSPAAFRGHLTEEAFSSRGKCS